MRHFRQVSKNLDWTAPQCWRHRLNIMQSWQECGTVRSMGLGLDCDAASLRFLGVTALSSYVLCSGAGSEV